MKKNSLPFSTRGFTLLELLTVIGVLSVIGTIAVSVISVTLRGTKKADLLESARQNSDSALTQMVKSIRYAQSLTSPASCVPQVSTSTITVTSITTHTPIVYACTGTTITQNGSSLFDTNQLTVSNCSFVCAQANQNVPPTITIQYILSPKVTRGLVETDFSIPFQSSVTMRNL